MYSELSFCVGVIWWMLSNQFTVYTGLARRDPMLTRKMIFGCCHQILPVKWQQVEQESGAPWIRAGSCWPAVPGMAPTRRAGRVTFQALQSEARLPALLQQLKKCNAGRIAHNMQHPAMHQLKVVRYIMYNLNLALDKAILTASIAVRTVSLRCWVSNLTLPLPSQTAYICHRSNQSCIRTHTSSGSHPLLQG